MSGVFCDDFVDLGGGGFLLKIYIKPPSGLDWMQMLAWEVGRDAGFNREPHKRWCADLINPRFRKNFMDGYRSACMRF